MKTIATTLLATARKTVKTAAVSGFFATAGLLAISVPAAAQNPLLPPPVPTVSTAPSNGDVNPYGVAFVPGEIRPGVLQPGDILVSNFNNSQNLQGTGTTILRVDGHAQTSTFFQGKAPLGLTAALGVARRGFVFVGNMPTTDGTPNTLMPGSLLILDNSGNLIGSVTGANINGPWGLAIRDLGESAQIFVSNVLSGTVVRFDVVMGMRGLAIERQVQIGSGFAHRTDPAALVLGPSGLYYDAPRDTLFVASSADNAVYAITQASEATSSQGTGKMIYQDNVHLHGPIDLVMAPNGDLIAANSDGSNVDPNQPSELVEFTIDGTFVTQFSVDANNGGAFGIAIATSGKLVRFAAVDDNAVTLTTWTEHIH